MKFELLKLMANGLPYEVIPELEQSEFYDWLAASQALDIDRKLVSMNVAISPHQKNEARSGEFNRLKSEQLILLGDNPFEVSQDAINRTRERLRRQGRVKKVKA